MALSNLSISHWQLCILHFQFNSDLRRSHQCNPLRSQCFAKGGLAECDCLNFPVVAPVIGDLVRKSGMSDQLGDPGDMLEKLEQTAQRQMTGLSDSDRGVIAEVPGQHRQDLHRGATMQPSAVPRY